MKNLKKLTDKLTVLYVEDEQESREQISEIFTLLFKSVDTAFDGADALEKFHLHSYDLVITDINMPRMDGIQLIKHIKIQKPTQNIIIISAHNDSTYLIKAIDMGVDSFIIKPIKMEQLTRVLTKVANQIYSEKLSQRYSEELEKEIEEKTIKLAQQFVTDELTGLLNRNALVKRYSSKKIHQVMLVLSIDNFDSINITYGYDNGDLVLKEVANFLKSKVPQDTKLYRVNSNEFAIVSAKKSLNEMQNFAKIIQDEIISHQITFGNFSIKISVTIALAEGKESLLKNAHIALKESRKIAKNRIHIYQKNSPIELLQIRIQTYMPKLRKVIAKKYIEPYFQPIINNKTKNIEKYECLARIINDDNKVESPLEFIDIAELTGMIPDITRIMIDKSFKAFANNAYEFSINISEFDLNDGYLRKYFQEKLQQYNIDASRVVIEVLEGISAIGAKNSLEQLMELKADGFAIAIDDFGVQNSNFERVHSMQVDFIKIDGSFIKNIYKDPKSYNVAKTITDFGKSIGAKIIAEYVHSKEVQDIVVALGIDYSQGYYFSEPLQSIQ